jgi:hypothetical protein
MVELNEVVVPIHQNNELGPVSPQAGLYQSKLLMYAEAADGGINHFRMIRFKRRIQLPLEKCIDQLVIVYSRPPWVDMFESSLRTERRRAAQEKYPAGMGRSPNAHVPVSPETLCVDLDIGSSKCRIIPPRGETISQGLSGSAVATPPFAHYDTCHPFE